MITDLDADAMERLRAWRDDRWPRRLFLPVYSERGLCPMECLMLEEGIEHPGVSGGLVLADPLGRLMLGGQDLADGTGSAELVREVGLWLVEGAPRWIGAALEWSDADASAPAVLGLVQPASWSRPLADRIPDGAPVRLATTAAAAERIAATLADRMRENRIQLVKVADAGRAV